MNEGVVLHCSISLPYILLVLSFFDRVGRQYFKVTFFLTGAFFFYWILV